MVQYIHFYDSSPEMKLMYHKTTEVINLQCEILEDVILQSWQKTTFLEHLIMVTGAEQHDVKFYKLKPSFSTFEYI